MNEDELFIEFSELDGGLISISKSQIKMWENVYPTVHVIQEIKYALCWLHCNPTRKRRNIMGFLNSWLYKATTKQNHKPTKHAKRQQMVSGDEWERLEPIWNGGKKHVR